MRPQKMLLAFALYCENDGCPDSFIVGRLSNARTQKNAKEKHLRREAYALAATTAIEISIMVATTPIMGKYIQNCTMGPAKLK